jgi:hypothetical protein
VYAIGITLSTEPDEAYVVLAHNSDLRPVLMTWRSCVVSPHGAWLPLTDSIVRQGWAGSTPPGRRSVQHRWAALLSEEEQPRRSRPMRRSSCRASRAPLAEDACTSSA